MIPFWCAPLFVLVHPEALFADRDEGTCRDNKDEFGFALVGHDYSTIRADNFGHCFLECSSGEKCQSVTFLWNTKECKLNNETKKSRPEAFQKHPAATYMENQFRGMTVLFNLCTLIDSRALLKSLNSRSRLASNSHALSLTVVCSQRV